MLRETCASLPDKRTGSNARYTMADIGMAAFSVFFMQSPSFLAHQRHLQDGTQGLSARTIRKAQSLLDGAVRSHLHTSDRLRHARPSAQTTPRQQGRVAQSAGAA